MMYEPFFWSKGINDYLNEKYYELLQAPTVPDR